MTLKALNASRINPIELHIVVIEQAEKEYQRHISNERQDMSKHFKTLFQTGVAVLQQPQKASWQSQLSAIQSALATLPDDLVASSHLVAHETSCLARAQLRLKNGISPGRRGSGNAADCIITEHLLELARTLRTGGFAQRFIFVSSNIKDFGPIGQPKPPLDVEFANLSMDYLPDIEAAMIGLGF